MQREGERSEARMGDGSKTAEGSKHAEGQANGPGEPRKNQEGEGEQENIEQGQNGRASRHAMDLYAKYAPTTSEPGPRFDFAESPTTTRPPKPAREGLRALFQQSLPCKPRV